MVPGPALPQDLAQKILHTINCLGLNSDDHLVQDRCNTMVMFANGIITLPFLELRYPFLAFEVKQQGIELTANSLFKSPTAY